MPVVYKINVLDKLKNAGISTYKMRQEKIFAEGTIQAFRRGDMVNMDNIGRVCQLLQCQPGDIVEYIPDGENLH